MFLKIWSLEEQQCLQVIPTHYNEIWEFVVDYEEDVIIFGSNSDKLTIKRIKDKNQHKSQELRKGTYNIKSKYEIEGNILKQNLSKARRRKLELEAKLSLLDQNIKGIKGNLANQGVIMADNFIPQKFKTNRQLFLEAKKFSAKLQREQRVRL